MTGRDGTELTDMLARMPGLELRSPGIWFAERQGTVSYPEHCHAACLTVEEGSFWFRHRNRCLIELVRRFAGDGPLFDIGGGRGYVAKGLMAAGIRCALLEPGLDAALAAHARGIAPVICARLEDVGLLDGSLANCGLFDVLEHIDDETGALRRIRALLEPGGRLFLTVPAYPGLFSEDDEAAGHFRRYRIRSLRRVLETAGFSVAFASYLFAPLLAPVFLLRTLPSWLGLGSKAVEDMSSMHEPAGPAAYLMDWLLACEAHRLEAGRLIPFGTSCLCVARKL